MTELQFSQAVKIAGATSAGVEQQFVEALFSAPVGTESGLVTRNIPSGTQNVSVSGFPNGAVDLYGRVRVSQLSVIVASNFSYNDEPYLVDSIETGAGAHSGPGANEPLITMTTSTASGDKCDRFTRRYYRYQVARTHVLFLSILIGTTHPNCRKRFGIFNADNGVFWEVTGSTLKVVVRSKTSGNVVDTAVNQSAWNLDKMDGTGASGITLDFTKFNIFVFEYIWQGSGGVRFGILNGSHIVFVHEISFSNQLISTYTGTMYLPIRWTIENTGTVSGTQTLRKGSFSYSFEQGGGQENGWEFSADNGVTTRTISSGSYLPLLAIRPKATFAGLTNRTVIIPIEYNISPQSLCAFQIVLNPTLTGGSWVSVDAGSSCEFNQTATSYTGGRVIRSGYASNARDSGVKESGANLSENLALVLSEAAATGDIFLIGVRGLGGNTQGTASIAWKEIY